MSGHVDDLRELWLGGQDDRLCAREQAKGWALREVWFCPRHGVTVLCLTTSWSLLYSTLLYSTLFYSTLRVSTLRYSTLFNHQLVDCLRAGKPN